jgi:hypothetical protein
MRHRARIQPYVTPELRRQIAARAAAEGVTESAYIEAGMRKYVEGDGVDEGLVIRRLDALTQAVAKSQDDLEVLAQAFSWFAKFSFMVAPAPGPDARSKVDFLFEQLLARVGSDLARGVRLSASVRRATAAKPPPAPGSESQKSTVGKGVRDE